MGKMCSVLCVKNRVNFWVCAGGALTIFLWHKQPAVAGKQQ